MPQSFLVFDFGTNEEAAQQARHRLEGWRQALRLGDRLQFKFERIGPEPPATPPAAPEAADGPEKKRPKKKSTKKKKEASAATPSEPAAPPPDRLRVLVRLEFSDHEKLSYQRWFDRIPAEPPFPGAEKQVVRRGQEDFDRAAALFDELP